MTTYSEFWISWDFAIPGFLKCYLMFPALLSLSFISNFIDSRLYLLYIFFWEFITVFSHRQGLNFVFYFCYHFYFYTLLFLSKLIISNISEGSYMWFTEQRSPLNRKMLHFWFNLFLLQKWIQLREIFLLNKKLSFLMSKIQIDYTLCFSFNDFITLAASSLVSLEGGHIRR